MRNTTPQKVNPPTIKDDARKNRDDTLRYGRIVAPALSGRTDLSYNQKPPAVSEDRLKKQLVDQ